MPSTKPAADGPVPLPDAGGPGDGVGRGDERIGAVVDVEQHALRALEQDAPAGAPRFVEVAPDRAGEGQHEIGDRGEVAAEALAVDRRLAEAGAERVVVGAQAVELGVEFVQMGKVADADRAAADLVLIGRADAAAGGADLARARWRPRAARRGRGGSAGSAGRSRRSSARRA